MMTCKTCKTHSFVTLVVNFSGFKCNPRIVWCSSGISICSPLPRSQISPSMPPLVLFIISMFTMLLSGRVYYTYWSIDIANCKVKKNILEKGDVRKQRQNFWLIVTMGVSYIYRGDRLFIYK